MLKLNTKDFLPVSNNEDLSHLNQAPVGSWVFFCQLHQPLPGIVFLGIEVNKPAMAKTKAPKKTVSDEELNNKGEFDQQQTEAKDSSASKRKKDKLKEDGDAYIEIPDVSDIPGQEKITNAGVPAAM